MNAKYGLLTVCYNCNYSITGENIIANEGSFLDLKQVLPFKRFCKSLKYSVTII